MDSQFKVVNDLPHYLALMRVEKPIGTLLLLWPTLWALWVASNGSPNAVTVWIFTLGVFVLSYFDDTLLLKERELITSIDFKTVLLDVMLSFLLFAGALHTNFQQLKIQRKPVLIFATLGTFISTFLAGVFVFYALKLINLDVDFMQGKMTTTEVLAISIWEEIEEDINKLSCKLHAVKIKETENNFVEYFGPNN